MADSNQSAARGGTAPIDGIGRSRSGGCSLAYNADPVTPDEVVRRARLRYRFHHGRVGNTSGFGAAALARRCPGPCLGGSAIAARSGSA